MTEDYQGKYSITKCLKDKNNRDEKHETND